MEQESPIPDEQIVNDDETITETPIESEPAEDEPTEDAEPE